MLGGVYFCSYKPTALRHIRDDFKLSNEYKCHG